MTDDMPHPHGGHQTEASLPAHAATAAHRQVLAFDSRHPPDPALIADCVHCGFCLPTCPTYLLWGEEMDSPRGRIYLMNRATEGEIGMDASFVRHMDQCLGCMACVTACPSGVQYDKLIEATRSQVERRFSRRPVDAAFRSMLFALFPYPARLRATVPFLWIYQRSGLRHLTQSSAVARLIPERLRAMERMLPAVRLGSTVGRIPAFTRAEGTRTRRVGLLTGCVQRVFFDPVNAATIRVLAAEGCDVVVPPDQGCCGALHVHGGREEGGLRRARKLIDTFEAWGVERVVVNAAGCGSTLKEYGHLLRDDPAYAERARRFAESVRDVSELLEEMEPVAPRHPLRLRVAYHDACHLGHAQGVRRQPRSMLRRIPELEIVDIPEADICCGSAGIYNLVEPEPAQELGQRKAERIVSVQPDVVATANPGCLLQIGAALRQANHALPALHPIELVDASIRGVPPPGVTAGGVRAAPAPSTRREMR
jgi:glycolate oxidase iron-sulfur subunit